MQNLRFERIADLDQLVLDRPERRGCVVLLHGYGADFTDLASLGEVIDPGQEWDWYFPNGPQEILIPGFAGGRAWFPLDIRALEEAIRSGDQNHILRYEAKGLAQASASIQGLVSELRTRYDRICIGGFSQGAMVSCDAALHLETKPNALFQLSGTLTAVQRWQSAVALHPERFPVVQSHGRHDAILPFSTAELLHSFWQQHHFPCRFLPFQGGHEIPYDVLQTLRVFLSEEK